MRKLLSIVVITSGVIFSGITEADSTLLIERLQQEGMLTPEQNILFKNAGEKPEGTVPSVPLLVPSATVTQPKSAAVPKQQTELSELKRKLSTSQRELQALRKQNQSLKSRQPTVLTEQSEAFSDENKQLHQQLLASEKQLAENARRHEKQVVELTARAEALQTQMTHIQLAANETVSQKALLEQQLAKQSGGDSALTARLAEAEKQGALLRTELEDEKKKSVALNENIAALEKTSLESTTRTAALEQNLKEATSQKTLLEQQLAKQSSGEKELTTQLAEAGKQSSEQLSQLNAANDKISEQLNRLGELEQKVKKADEEKTHALERMAALQKQLDAMPDASEKAKLSVFSLKKHNSELEKVNYAYGAYYAVNVLNESKIIENAGYAFLPQAFQQGLKDKLGKTMQLTEEEVGNVLARLDRKVSEVASRENGHNKKQSAQFVAQAAKAKGAEQTQNGVVYLVVKKGKTPVLTANDTIRFRLDEKISTGKKLSAGEVRIGLVNTLPELMQQGVLRVGRGGKVRITVPSELAYGEQGIPGTVPPGVASEITIEVLGIVK